MSIVSKGLSVAHKFSCSISLCCNRGATDRPVMVGTVQGGDTVARAGSGVLLIVRSGRYRLLIDLMVCTDVVSSD
jgi:hypothetical protein